MTGDTRASIPRPLDKDGPNTSSRAGALTDVAFWDSQQTVARTGLVDAHRPKWFGVLSSFLPQSPNTTFLEVGVVPGGVMFFFAQKMRYRCTGLDFSPQVRHLPALFAKQGIEATFVEADFLNWASDETFDIVYSNGFIEHFTDYETVIHKHWERVRPGGLMIVGVPTFTTLCQWWLRRFFYEPWLLEKVVSSHNFDIMKVETLKKTALKICENAEVVRAIREPGMPIWFRYNSVGIRRGLGRTIVWIFLKVVDRVLRSLGIVSRWCSGAAVLLVKKRMDQQAVGD